MIRSSIGLTALAVTALFATATLQGAETASATISQTQISPGEFQYTVTLNDTGTTTLGTFWFSWVPGDNFMPVSPTSVTSPTGWHDTVTNGGPSNGFAIQWTAVTPANDLTAGGTLPDFSFDSSLTLAQLESPSTGHPSDPVLTAFVYSGAPFSDAGFQLAATPAVVATPEPSIFSLCAVGLAALLVSLGRRHILQLTRST